MSDICFVLVFNVLAPRICYFNTEVQLVSPLIIPLNYCTKCVADEAASLRKLDKRDSLSSDWTKNSFHIGQETEIIVRPSNDVVSQLSSLNFANQTFSPYTPNVEHFAIRSAALKRMIPYIYRIPSDRQGQKAKRRRMYHIRGKELPRPFKDYSSEPHLVEFDLADINQYFTR